jgi:hypothetical protein
MRSNVQRQATSEITGDMFRHGMHTESSHDGVADHTVMRGPASQPMAMAPLPLAYRSGCSPPF